ncbi:MAG: fumarate hydratase [Candidatus Bathyarchaeota archaeon B26-2]|nr:MAG: fumarate hydratase [Candidatus Bathyarchaeota archaeon B26-2]
MNRTLRLKTPLSEMEIRRLKVGDIVYLSGIIVTARDAAHKRMLDLVEAGKPLPINLRGFPIYHCGPLVRMEDGRWIVLAAGPTTSMRMEPLESVAIEKLGVRMVIGKGGMGKKTADAMARFGSVYGAFTGGAAILAARHVTRVVDVKWLDLGVPEALWVLEVKGFGPLIIAIDSHGNNLFGEVNERAWERYRFALQESGEA